MTLSHPTRREFFTYVGAVSAAPVFRAQAKDAHRWDASFDVVIVGSGAAGLQNLLLLLQRGGSAAAAGNAYRRLAGAF